MMPIRRTPDPKAATSAAERGSKLWHAVYEKISDDGVEKAPKHVHRRRGQALARRFREGALKRPPHHAADKMRNGVREEGTAEDVGRILKPLHQGFLWLRRVMISARFVRDRFWQRTSAI